MMSTIADTSVPRIAASADERRINTTDSLTVDDAVVVVVVVVFVASFGMMLTVAATSAIRVTVSVDTLVTDGTRSNDKSILVRERCCLTWLYG